MVVRLSQPSFATGEVSPALYSRVDINKYSTALKTAQNFFIHPSGGASNRAGTHYVATVKDSSKATRVVPFKYSQDEVYIIEFGDYYCRFYMDGSQIDKDSPAAYAGGTPYAVGDFVTDGGIVYYCIQAGTGQTPATSPTYWTAQTAYEIVTPYAAADLFELKFAQSADVLYIAHQDYPPATLSRYGDDDWRYAEFAYEYGPFMPGNIDKDNELHFILIAAWDSAVTYAVGDLVTHGTGVDGAVAWKCIQAGTGKDPDTEAAYWAGVVYDAGTGYVIGDYVRDVGIGYFCIQAGTGKTPASNPTYWTPEGTYNYTCIAGKSANITSDVAMFDSDHVGALFRINESIEAQSMTEIFTTTRTSAGSLSLCGASTWRLVTHGTWTGTLTLEKSIDNGVNWIAVRVFASKADINHNTYGTIEESEGQLRLNYTDTSGTCTVDLSVDAVDKYCIFEVSNYLTSTSVRVLLKSSMVVSNNGGVSPAGWWEWAEGSWSVYRGFPACVSFYQDRLCWASSASEPQTIWMSKTGQYTDYGTSIPLVDTDGIGVNLPSKELNAVNSILGLSNLLAFTSSSEWAVGLENVITPTSIGIKNQGYNGCSKVPPITIGNKVLYIQPMGTVVRDLGYDIQVDGFAGENISLLADHLFDNKEIVEMAFQQNPDGIVWCVRDDGALLALTYLKEQMVVAWSQHITDGDFESVACIPGDYVDEVWFVVKRGNYRYVEYMKERQVSTNPRDQFFVDCGVTYDTPLTITGITKANPPVVTSAGHNLDNDDHVYISEVVGMTEVNGKWFTVANKGTDTFELNDIDTDLPVDGSAYTAYVSGGEARLGVSGLSGLDWLANQEVVLLNDGNVETQTVTAGGDIVFDNEGCIFQIGLPYTSILESLRINMNMRDGGLLGRFVKIPQVTVYFLNSRGGYVGPDADHLDELKPIPPELLDEPIALYSGEQTITMPSDYQIDGRIYYKQTDPLPVTIAAFVPVVNVGGTSGYA